MNAYEHRKAAILARRSKSVAQRLFVKELEINHNCKIFENAVFDYYGIRVAVEFKNGWYCIVGGARMRRSSLILEANKLLAKSHELEMGE